MTIIDIVTKSLSTLADRLEASEHAWAQSPEAVLELLGVDPRRGLDESEASRRRRRFGPNRLRRARRRSSWAVLADQFESIVIALLLGAATVSFAFGEHIEGGAILVVVVLNAAIGFASELRAVRSMEALRRLATVETRVRRAGRVTRLPAEELVPGDVVVVEGGDVVTADLRLIEASRLEADESTLTGESVPVAKGVQAVPEDAPLAERSSMLYKGTAATRGAGEGVVIGTGMRTELGRISSLVEEAETRATPLETRLDQLAKRLVWLTLAIVGAVAVAGIARGRDALLIIETAIALAVAAVPEGLPIVATLALARGMWRMARRNALIERLAAVETLGSTTLILTDKTGTLTENRMTVVRLLLPALDADVDGDGQAAFTSGGKPLDPNASGPLRRALVAAVLCNDASLEEDGESIGDPMEVALLAAGAKAGIRRGAVLEALPEIREEAFDPDLKMMATVHAQDHGVLVAVKGAPEAVLQRSTRILTDGGERECDARTRERWLARNAKLAAGGLRVLAVADKSSPDFETEPYTELTFLGLIGLEDPPREEVRSAIEACKEAGIRLVMLTGDQAPTARHVAAAVSLSTGEDEPVIGSELDDLRGLSPEGRARVLQSPVFARTTPEQKLALISLHQDAGEVVAMLGDGVNDAPALKQADIGVAMGRRGTQVAREAAAMVLQDDQLGTVVSAVEQGRVIFRNIRQFVVYLLSCNLSEVMIVGLAALSGAPLPLLPLQILFLNLVTDVFPALALGAGENGSHVMGRRPRARTEQIVERTQWLAISGYAGLITAAVLGALAIASVALGMETERAVTVSFLTLAFAQLWHVFNVADASSGLLRNEVTTNRWVWGALALCTSLLMAAAFLPVLSDVLDVVDPGPSGWALILGMSLAPLVVGRAAAAARAHVRP